ncbi:NACHT, LRR and PYD domains-containing protein 12-like [Sparus aurata]|nr:NACHT, LRR and PYD domains-containing protein 12-like [Sparus aurata]
MATPAELLATLKDLADGEFKEFKWFLQQADILEGFPAIPKSHLVNADRLDTVDEITDTYDKNAVEVTIKVLKEIKKNDLVQRLSNINSSSKEALTDCQRKLKFDLRKKFQHLFVQSTKSGKQMLMNEIYTELHITDENLERTVTIGNLLELLPGQDGSLRSLMMKGVSGIGKTVTTQKFALDWAEDKVNSNTLFIFPFTFRELNLLKGKKYCWLDLIHHFFADTKGAGTCSFDKFPSLFILDGLDECQLALDFHNNEILTDVTDSASVDVLLTNLIMGKLFPSAQVWITTTPEAAGRIPRESIDMVTEVRGFSHPKQEEYIRKRFRNKELASRIISHIKTSRSLHIMCNIPVFCWITATVLEDMLKTDDRGELPKTLTEMYIHFLLVQSKLANVKHHGRSETDPIWSTETRTMILSLGKLAFEQLQKGNLIFYEENLVECGIDIGAASKYSEVISEIFKEDRGLHQDRQFSFVHLSFQEFLATIHVIVSFINSGINLLSEEQSTSKQSVLTTEQSEVSQLYQSAVTKAMQSSNGHLDLFLRFLSGLSLQNNQELLQDLLKQSGSSLQSNQDTVQYIKQKIRENPCPERCINLFHCLNELKDQSLVEEIQQYLSSGCFSSNKLSPAQWSALVFILLSSENEFEVLDLKKFSASEKGFLRLQPVVQASCLAMLSGCNLSWRSCEALASVLGSKSSNLRELDLSYNPAVNQSFKELTRGLTDPQCKLETLRLSSCELRPESLEALSTVLSCQSSSLRRLDLTNNCLRDSGVELLSAGLESPHCRLETLRLIGCGLTWKSCDAVAFFLNSQSSCLKQLDLSMNKLQDSGVQVFSAGLESPHSKLETLRISACDLSGKSCEALASVLTLQTSSLRVLDLTNNSLEDSGAKFLSAGLQSPHCTLECLRLSHCLLSERSCESLASALTSQPSSLKELDLSTNDLLDSGVKLLSAGLESPQCRLETLRLSGCLVTEEGCCSLASALSSNPSHLRELDLSYNHPGDTGVALLSAGLEDPQWRLETLNMDHGGEQRLQRGLQKYHCELTLDPNTAHRRLKLSEDHKRVEYVEEKEEQSYPFHPERFNCFKQLMCRNALAGRCYWEIEIKGLVDITVTYRGISRRGHGYDCKFGRNDKSWSLQVYNWPALCHNNTETQICCPHSENSTKVAVYLDWPAGSLSFYKVDSDTLAHIYPVYSRFTEPLYPGFGFERSSGGASLSLSLCQEDD